MSKKKEPALVNLDVTPKQADMIVRAEEAVRAATERRNLLVQAIVAGHEVPEGATVVQVLRDPPRIVLRPSASE